MKKLHDYKLSLKWKGNLGEGTATYRSYTREYSVQIEGKPELLGSSDPYFRGDKSRHNPEDMLIASLSACHMLSYLHVCAVAGVVVVDYVDHATGLMETRPDGSGSFVEVTLYPIVTVADESMMEKANELHAKANQLCFIANSVNFPVKHVPEARRKLNVNFKEEKRLPIDGSRL